MPEAVTFVGREALESRLERGPVALVIAQAHWTDGSSAGLLERVARFAADHAVAIVVLRRPDDAGPGDLLHAVEDELVIDDLAGHIDLVGLEAAGSAEAEALRQRPARSSSGRRRRCRRTTRGGCGRSRRRRDAVA